MVSDSTIILPEKKLYVPSKEETIVLVFNGQGAWFKGMGRDLCEFEIGRETYEKVSYFASVAIEREITVEDLRMERSDDSCMQLLATYVYGVALTKIREDIEEEDKISGNRDITVRITDAKIWNGARSGRADNRNIITMGVTGGTNDNTTDHSASGCWEKYIQPIMGTTRTSMMGIMKLCASFSVLHAEPIAAKMAEKRRYPKAK